MVKDEGRLPTGSFKARGLALAVSMAKELGIRKVAMPTNGDDAVTDLQRYTDYLGSVLNTPTPGMPVKSACYASIMLYAIMYLLCYILC